MVVLPIRLERAQLLGIIKRAETTLGNCHLRQGEGSLIPVAAILTAICHSGPGNGPGVHTCGMSEDKKFCPHCKAMTMEPAEGVAITAEEVKQMEPGQPVFEGHLTPYQCPVCLHFAYIPVF
jgi:hypothetical protein